MDESIRHHNPSPYLRANFLSRMFFWWLNPIFMIGYKRSIEVEDMYNVVPEDSSYSLSCRLEVEWEKEIEKKKMGRGKPSLFKAIVRTFGRKYAILGIITLFEEGTKVIQPILLGNLIRYFLAESTVSRRDAYLYAMGVSLCAFVLAIAHHPYFFEVQRIGMQIRIATCSLLYKKTLRLSNKAQRETTTGQIVNLMSNDVNRFDQASIFLHFLWVGPIQAIAVLTILWYELGPASLAGFGVLVFLIPIQGWMGKMFSKLRQKTARHTDERVRIMNEIISGMRVIKMYCWEKPFGELVRKVRRNEMYYISKSRRIKALHICLFNISGAMLIFAMLVVYTGLGNTLYANKTFLMIGLVNVMQLSLITMAPMALQFLAESSISVRRLQLSIAYFIIVTGDPLYNKACKFILVGAACIAQSEMYYIFKSCRIKSLHISLFFLSAKMLILAILVTYASLGNILLADKAYVMISLVNGLQLSMMILLPLAVQTLAESSVSTSRIKAIPRPSLARLHPDFDHSLNSLTINFHKTIQRFLLLDELEKLDHSKTTDTFTDVIDPGITLSNVTSKWDENVEQNTLQDISVSVKPGKLLAVIGPVGAGKTSLLMAILREIPLLSGEATVRGKIGYTGQIPWVFSSSLRQNILFGQKYDRVKYDRIIKVCALNKDLEIFPNGDGTLIGERGVSLSGGQRSRVSLARALYMNTDVYLLDDPLSAVDAAVGRHIFNKCIMGYLKDKPRILVTHQLQYLKEADEILVLKEGKMLAIGTFDELCESGIDFTSLLKREDDEGEADAISRDAVAHMSDVDVSRSFSHTSIPKLIDVGSTLSLDTIEFKPEPVQVQEEEARRSGAISMSVFRDYFKAGTNIVTFTFLVLLNIVAQASFNVSDWWLSYWVNNEEARSVKVSEQNALLEYGYNVTNVTIPEVDTHFYMYIYIGITLTVFVFGLLRALLFFKIAVLASQKLHDVMFSSMLRTQILFFDTNPVGRILNRFSKDVGHMDDLLPITFYDFIQCTMLALGIVLVAGIVNPWVFIPALPLIILLIMIRYFFIKTSRNIKRLEATTRSSVFSHLSASIHGLWTIRAFGVQDKFIEQFDSHQDIHTEAWFLFITTTRWLAVRLDWLCAIFVASVTFCSVFASESLDAGLVGLSVTYAMTLMGMFQWAVRQSAELENQMVSVERILEYSRLPSEAPLESDDKHCPPKSWPHHGIISAEKAQLRYSENAPNVLKDLNFYIYSEEKVGIVGRTGAGKSSLLTMLFRLVEPEGCIVIDGIDIKNIGLHDLREKISIIPQDPVLFTGTVRTNLDPFMQHADTGLWTALEEVQLKRVIEELPGGLDWAVSESGINFSVGQRQLLCLARAILRQNKILIIDEATANVDVRTDMLIQQTIRDKFRFCTVLTIAHRLHTIMDSDRVMVLEEGRIVQFEHPYTLLQNKHGHFYKTVEQTGRVEQERLIAIAKQSHDKSKRDTTSLFTADSIPLMDGSLPSPSLQINSAPQSTSNTGLRSRGLKNPAVDHHLAPLAEPDMFNSRDQLDTGSTEQDRLLHSLTNSVNI